MEHLRAGEAGTLWSRLTAVDFFGNSFQLAALAILCFFPLLIVITSAADRSTAAVLAGWLGLDHRASQAVATLFNSGSNSSGLTVVSVVMLVLAALTVAGTLQNWYARVFGVSVHGWRVMAVRLLWLASILGYGAAHAVAGRALGKVGGPVLPFLVGFVLSTLFWWWSMAVLLAGTVPWRELLPAALVTAFCWMGLGVFSALYFSQAIVTNEQRYGPIGVVMIILSWVVAVGVVIHLGSVIGYRYRERREARR
ncbi:YhjD/YihY/BrkB family envelope integrity protein [Streptomyces orinoci]|uniref:YhjD/YihY/BrkB family envelope integrity protein n=1 Tax=Streptomyces orinoci TaxID=67339 RepID=A0ABV3K1R6_STRON|nr:YhjD/YihY/BrkB family envelope integrity protein [Streptomyces orinoci]